MYLHIFRIVLGNLRTDRLEKERDQLLSWIGRSVSHTSSLMIGQFSGELQRFFQMIRFMQILQNLVNRGQDLSERGHTYSQKIAEIICGREEIKGGVLANLRELVNSLESCHPCGLGISEQERIEIVQAVGLSRGHWYKCPFGHVYVIGECGGAMEEAVCYECQNTGKGPSVRIGGTSHRLREGNQLAGEMDGARAAAWPDLRLDGMNGWD